MLAQERNKLAAAEVPSGVSAELNAGIKGAIAEAFVDGFRLVMFVAVGLALLSAFVALVMIRDKSRLVTNNFANADGRAMNADGSKQLCLRAMDLTFC